jgi:hypothetical protein
MIVSDDNVRTALVYLADDPHPLALAIKAVTDAENDSREVFARFYLSASGAAETRKQIATSSPDYIAAKAAEAEAIFDRERHRSRKGAAEMLLEIWRTENANARAAERIR